ncbi:fibrobacter succinogenes major paralogous domain-containing protein, partial [Bacteroidales bacterium OttesenSCG-928-C03]|nr:fibrobacter succinogenes major paralogous domain-containing protein [Bacteroidales bacterium OttesenSCG-928-C03]
MKRILPVIEKKTSMAATLFLALLLFFNLSTSKLMAQYTITPPANAYVEVPEGTCDYELCNMDILGTPAVTATDGYTIESFYVTSITYNGTLLNPDPLQFLATGVYPILFKCSLTYRQISDGTSTPLPVDVYSFLVVNFKPCGTMNEYVTGVQHAGDYSSSDYTSTYFNRDTMVYVSDIQDNRYATTRVGCDCWTAENLRSTRYASDGAEIDPTFAYFTDQYDFQLPDPEKWGLLYDYNTATRGGTDVFGIRGVCPDGWYIPTPEQYRNLFSVGVNQLKATTDWLDVINSTNSSGFSALPAGYFNWAAQTSQHLLGDAYFWTSQNDNDGNATIAHIHFGCNDLLMEQMRVQNGLSVRCVKIDPSHCNMPPSITNIPNTINLGCEDETFNININANDKIGQNAYLQITLSPAVIADSIIFQHQISGSMVDITFVNGVALIDESSMATTGLEDMTASFHIQLADNTVNTQTATINWAIVNSTNTTEVWSSMKTSLLELQPPIEPTMNIVFEGTKPYQIGCDSLPFKAIITVGTCIGEAGYTFEYVGEQNVGDVYYSLNNSDWRKVGENDEGGLTITQDTTIYFYLDNQYMPGEEIDTSIYLYFRLYDGDITIVDTTYANEPDADPTFEVTTAFAIMTMTDVKGNLIEFEENIPLTLDYAPDTLYVAIAPSVCSKGEGLIKIQGHADVAPYISLEYFERFGGANVWRLIEFKEDGSAWFDGGATGGFDIEPISVMLRIRQKQCTNNSELTNDGLPFTFTMVATDSTTVVSNTITQNVFCNRVPDCITIENNITGSICGAANFEVNINFGESGGPSVFPVAGGVKGEVTITLAEPTYKDSISLSFHNRAGGNDQWDMLTFDENGVAVFDGGMSGGFPLGSDQNYPVNFKITTAANLADHKLPYTLRLV